MAELIPREPQSAADYDDRTTTAVKSVLIEIGQILGSFKGKFAVVGGAVPWLLLNNEDMPHVGSLDVDLSLDAEALGDGEYVTLIDALRGQGYDQRKELRRFQLVRKVPAKDGGAPIDIIVDFLMPRDAEIVKNNPPLLNNFALQRADGADLALRFYQMVAIDGPMPAGGTNRVEIAVCSIPALLAMKGHALRGRHKQKETLTISTIASGTIPTGSAHSQKHADRFCTVPRAKKATATSPRNSTRRAAMDQPVSGTLSQIPKYWASALPTSGNRTPSVRLMNGCARLGYAKFRRTRSQRLSP
jgi:hypothetical protein